MGKKRKIKRRKERLTEYNINTVDIPRHDPVERVMYCLGDKLTVDRVKKIIEKKNKILEKQSYSLIKITYYEYPVGSERPRSTLSGGFIRNYVPNAKDNKKYFESLIKDIKKDIKIIHTPIYIKCKTYHPMPESASIEEKVLFEAGILHPVTKPDFDNIFKVYTDMMLEQLILDDDLIYKATIEKFYSFLPRVEIEIYYEDSFASKYIYNKIRTRKSFKKLLDRIELSKVLL